MPLAKFQRVIIESPYSGDVARNLRYLKDARADCVRRGESPYASHWMLTDILNDLDAAERRRGMELGLYWTETADGIAVYHDLGVTPGMRAGIERAEGFGKPVDYRSLPEWAKLYIDGQYIGNGHHL